MKDTKNGYQNRIEIVQGTLDMLILKTLQWGEQHGYGISAGDSREFGRDIAGGDGLAVSRAAQAGAAGVGFVGVEEEREQPAREVLQDNRAGKKQLASDYERWGRMVETIEAIMNAERGEA